MRRIIQLSSNEEDLVADFYCGSGTTLVAAFLKNKQKSQEIANHFNITQNAPSNASSFGQEYKQGGMRNIVFELEEKWLEKPNFTVITDKDRMVKVAIID